ncbi:MAG: RNA 2',3'-cyclic phosphodiesterase [Rhodothermia bacterium]
MIRAFLAIQPPEEVRAELACLDLEPQQRPQQRTPQRPGQRSARQSGWRWVPQENVHLTVRFLGTISEETFEVLMPEMDRLGRGLSRTKIEIEHVTGFPVERPTVIAAAIAPTRKLTRLAERVETMVTGIGLEAESRPFRPHITIARLKRSGYAMANLHVALRLSFTARELVLFKSERGRDGARYIRVHSTRLGM